MVYVVILLCYLMFFLQKVCSSDSIIVYVVLYTFNYSLSLNFSNKVKKTISSVDDELARYEVYQFKPSHTYNLIS